MPKVAHLGEIHDDVVYTHKRLAAIIDRDVDWVLEEVVRPGDPSDTGVRCRKVGTNYFISGEAFRFWIERKDQCHGESQQKPR